MISPSHIHVWLSINTKDLTSIHKGGLRDAGLSKAVFLCYQVSFAAAIKKEVDMPTGAVGLITETHRAEDILVKKQADVIFLARELLRDPYWPLHAAQALGADVPWPRQYDRAKPHTFD